MTKRLLAVILLAALILPASAPVRLSASGTDDPIRIYIDGRLLSMNEEPIMVNNTTLVPFRPIFEALGFKVGWDNQTRTVTGKKEGLEIRLTLGSKTALVNGKPVQLAQAPAIVSGKTFVPLRFVSESSGKTTKWYGNTKTIQVGTQFDALAKIAHGMNPNEVERILGKPPIRIGDMEWDEYWVYKKNNNEYTVVAYHNAFVDGVSVFNDANDPPVYGRTKRMIIDRFVEPKLKATSYSNAYVKEPSYSAPYAAGEFHPGFLEHSLRRANFYRYLSGVPDDLVLDAELSRRAQHGAVLVAVSGYSHRPSQPRDMSDEFYEIASDATMSSSLCNCGTVQAVDEFMEDRGVLNVESVGHRRWVLSPKMKKTGFGLAFRPRDGEVFSTMYVLDQSRQPKWDYDYIPYPGKGYFPLGFLDYNTPWSVMLNPDKFEEPVLSEVTVELERLNDGKVWRLDQSDSNRTLNFKYLTVDTVLSGSTYAVIFHLGDELSREGFGDGDVYEVRIHGLKDIHQNPVDIQYQVHFFGVAGGFFRD